MTVPFLDIAAGYDELKNDIDAALARVAASGWFIGGPEVEGFEREWAAFCETEHTIGVGNGLDALHLALRAMGVGDGDEVISASHGFIATLLAISMTGAKPVLVEPDPVTFNLDPSRIEAAITPRTRVILPTHLYGHPADLDPILAIARERGLRVLEDAAQAHGARYKGRRIGGHSDAACWSFYPSKNLGAMGDGGAVTTNDANLAARIRELGNYGSSIRYVNRVRGVNSRLDPMQAAVMRAKIPHLNAWNDRRRAIAVHYRDALADTGIDLPTAANWADPVWHLFVVRSARREDLQRALADKGVQTLIHYPIPPHLQEAYCDLGHGAGDFPIAEAMADSLLSLPIGPHLSDADADKVVEAVRAAVDDLGA